MSKDTEPKTASTQHFLNIADIRDNTLILRNGELRVVLEVTALNFALKSEEEQSAIIYQYQAFLNSLQFPVQILIQSRRLDLTRYLASLQERLNQSTVPLIQNQIADYMDFVSRLVSLGNIMEKHFYVVVPYSSGAIRNRNFLAQLLKRETLEIDDKQFAEATAKLADRAEVIRSGLASIGLGVRPLQSNEMIQLLYSTYNPLEAGEAALAPNQAAPIK